MYQAQQPPLQGAYYGPPIPQQPYQRQRSCFCCLLSTLLKAFIAFCVALGIAILVLWIVFRPTRIKVAVERASLTRFNLTTNPTYLNYNLTTDISVRNPNKRIGIYYDWLEADSYYDGERFDSVALPTFYQGHKNTTMLYPVIEGRSFIGLGDSGVNDFTNDNKTGFFNVDVWLYGRIRYKFGSLITRRYTMRVKCKLGLPLVTTGTATTGFSRTECDLVDF